MKSLEAIYDLVKTTVLANSSGGTVLSSPSPSNQGEDSSHAQSQPPNWTVAFQLLVPSNALKGKETELNEKIEEIGMDNADDLSHAPNEMLIQIAELLKLLKKAQFLKACGIKPLLPATTHCN